MTTGADPYQVPTATDYDASNPLFETVITAARSAVNIGGPGGGVTAMADTYNGNIPGPLIQASVGDSIVVRLINNLTDETAIHWHGVDLANHSDGSPLTQNARPQGGTYLYKLHFPRPGLYWYHPHHHGSTNQVFRGLYGPIVVPDPVEALLPAGTLPGPSDTQILVLSDMTVCKAPGSNDALTYSSSQPWVGNSAGGPPLPVQGDANPVWLCQLPNAIDNDGNPALSSYAANEIPSIQVMMAMSGVKTNEGQTVLTNGMNVGGRGGTPSAPAATLDAGAFSRDVNSGQNIRLQIFNAATTRYFRLRLTTHTGALVQLFRIGGEGGLLNNPILEGGTTGSGFVTGYDAGEMLLPPGSRAEVVAAIPTGLPGGSFLTMWTEDFQRTGSGSGYSNIPTVPVMHLRVNGVASDNPISTSTVLRSGPNVVDVLPPATSHLLDPATFTPPKIGRPTENIQLSATGMHPLIDGVQMMEWMGEYTAAPHIDPSTPPGSSRWARVGDVVELSVENLSSAHHPIHFHGFPMQPKTLTKLMSPTFTFPDEFRDNIDLPAGYKLTFRMRLGSRNLVDDATPDGALGRWMFHCHIFFHAHLGMMSELVVTDGNVQGHEKPFVDVNGSWAYAPSSGTATRTGTYAIPDAPAVTLASITASPHGTVTDLGSGQWSWSYSGPAVTEYIYVTVTDSEGRKDQTFFRLKIGGADDGADNGDPHIHTVDGGRYDLQAAGEFTLLRDYDGMEIQTRQTPVPVANPATDWYTGLTSCVSVNTAVAARVGRHRVSYQSGRERKTLQLYLDGKPVEVPSRGLDLGEHRITTDIVEGGGKEVRIDYAHGPIVTITPFFWNPYGGWILNVSVAHTQAEDGLMGRIPAGTWLPALPNGATVGPMPATPHERWTVLNRVFAEAWRITDATSLFVYFPGESTAFFTDRNWPSENGPCTLSPKFKWEGAPLRGVDVKTAERICRRVTNEGLRQDCVFDVATTGDEIFEVAARLAQELRKRGTAVQLVADKPRVKAGEPVTVTATVTTLSSDAKRPRGAVTFFVDDVQTGAPVRIDSLGRAKTTQHGLKVGEHRLRASFDAGTRHGCFLGLFFSRKREHTSSSSPNLLLNVS